MLNVAEKLAVVVQDVSVSFQSKSDPGEQLRVLSRVNFDVDRGEILTVLGPNGCGKSTLLFAMAGLLEPNEGRVHYPFSRPGDPQPRKAVVFQDFGLFYWMTVWQNIEFGLKPLEHSPAERREIVRRFVDLVGLHGFEKSYPRQLSGGMQQRVAIARALAISPQFLFLDEPFASLDLQTRDLMQEEFLRIWEERRVTTVFVTHSIEEAIYLSHKVIVLTRRPGRIKLTVPVPFPFPRKPELRLTSDFLELKTSIWRAIREEI